MNDSQSLHENGWNASRPPVCPHTKKDEADNAEPPALCILSLIPIQTTGKGGKAMPLMEISVVPVGTKTSSFSHVVKEVCRVIDQKGLNYQVTPTATVIEGNIDQLMNVARDIHRTSLNNGVDRVITQITIDDRRDQPMDIRSQVAKVQPSSIQ